MLRTKEKKAALRKLVRARSAALTPGETAVSNREIFLRLTALPAYQASKTVFCFVGIAREIDTVPMLMEMWGRNVRAAVPLCISPGIMEAREITCMADLCEGSYGLLEPKPDSLKILPHEIDLSIVPCVSCDRYCNRLGQGGGYYDRFLKNRGFLAVALCREALLSEKIPVESWDQAVDMVMTETGIYERNYV